MKKVLIILCCIMLSGCVNNNDTSVSEKTSEQAVVTNVEGKDMYEQISAEQAYEIMNSEKDFTILDVREQDEYDSGHIPGAILIPYTEINEHAEEMLPEKDKLILVYCRSGRRSKIASESLVQLGYTNVKEFGGIIDWKYEVEK